MTRRQGLLVVVAGLVAAAAGGFVADRTLLRGEDTDAAPTPGGADAPAARTLPTIELPGLEADAVALADFTGRPLLVNFWATWCKPCRKEIPLLIALREEYADARLEIVGIAIDELEPTRRLAAELAIDYPVMVGEQAGIDALVAFGAPTTALPYTAVVDRDGRIVGGHVGELTREDALRLLRSVL